MTDLRYSFHNHFGQMNKFPEVPVRVSEYLENARRIYARINRKSLGKYMYIQFYADILLTLYY